jgi:hypothetical protein
MRVKTARQKSLRSSPVLIFPLVVAAILTIYLGVCNYLNTQGSKYRAVCIGSLVVCAVGDLLQHCAIYIQHIVAHNSTVPNLDITDTSEPAEIEGESTDVIVPIDEKSISRLASMSEAEKVKYWAESSLRPPGYGDWESLMAQVISEIPKAQGRPSTRRSG